MPDQETEIFVVTGTTAVGKTEFSLRWAEENDAEIISCDSTTVYRGMDIGTAKPTPQERARVPHHGLDLVEPSQKFSVGDYLEFAVPTVEKILARGKKILVSGGSGFYLKAFYEPVTDGIPVTPAVREQVDKLLASGNETATNFLRTLNPDGAPNFDWQNPRRVARALERCIASGKTISELRNEMSARSSPFSKYKKHTLLLTRAREDLDKRISLRVSTMFKSGLIDEVKLLISQHGLEENSPAGNAIGYRETIAWLKNGEQGGISALTDSIALATRQLAAKQRKWFRSQIPINEILDLTIQSVA